MNRINVVMKEAILRLFEGKRSQREIARVLDLDRGTVSKYVQQARAGSKPAIVPAGISGRKSICWSYQEQITGKLSVGLSAQRIYQDLKAEASFPGSYDSIKRFVRKLTAAEPRRFQRMESDPGEEAQVDFGTGARLIDEHGRRRKTHVLRVVLSCSRKAYSEAVLQQTTENFIRCLENAFRYFGGVPRTLVTDNLKAAVIKADWYDPTLNPKIEAFCRHYGTVLVPTRPRTPRHKGKIENGIGYVKRNGLKAFAFGSLAAQNQHLLEWEQNTADQRIHGTTRLQVQKAFQTLEKPALLPLPALPFPCYQEGRRNVHRDGFVEIQKAYYEVPDEYVTRQVWVRWDARLVHIFNHRHESIAVHARAQPGVFSRTTGTDSRGRGSRTDRSMAHLLGKVEHIGPHCRDWGLRVRHQRGPAAYRVLLGLLSMTRKHKAGDLDAACSRALTHEAFRLEDLRRLMALPSEQTALAFLDEHPVIRSLQEYACLLPAPPPPQETPT